MSKMTTGVRKRARQQVVLDRLLAQQVTQPDDLRITAEIATLTKKVGT